MVLLFGHNLLVSCRIVTVRRIEVLERYRLNVMQKRVVFVVTLYQFVSFLCKFHSYHIFSIQIGMCRILDIYSVSNTIRRFLRYSAG